MRRHFSAMILGLAGVLLGAALVSVGSADAATGDVAKVGVCNRAGKQTVFTAKAGATVMIRNQKNGKPALELRTTPSAPPMLVTSNVKVDNLNADYLDGYNASSLRSKAGGCGNSDITDGTNWTCTYNIDAPRAGILLMSGTVELYNSSGTTPDSVWCEFEVDYSTIGHSDRDIDVTNGADGDTKICSSTAWYNVDEAGSYRVDFNLKGVNAATQPGAGSMWVLFVPSS